MCVNVFIASDRKLPTVPWNPLEPSLYVRPVDELDQDLRDVFSKRHVYFVGSHEGCGDGFSFGVEPVESPEDEERERKARDSVRRLAAYLESVAEKGPVELFAQWSSGPASRNGAAEVLDLTAFEEDSFSIPENRLMVVQPA